MLAAVHADVCVREDDHRERLVFYSLRLIVVEMVSFELEVAIFELVVVEILLLELAFALPLVV